MVKITERFNYQFNSSTFWRCKQWYLSLFSLKLHLINRIRITCRHRYVCTHKQILTCTFTHTHTHTETLTHSFAHTHTYTHNTPFALFNITYPVLFTKWVQNIMSNMLSQTELCNTKWVTMVYHDKNILPLWQQTTDIESSVSIKLHNRYVA